VDSARWIIDTELLAEVSRRKPFESLIERIRKIQFQLAVSSVSISEISCRISRCTDTDQRLWLERWLDGVCAELVVIPLDLRAARLSGQNYGKGEEVNTVSAKQYAEIAACAAVNGLTLITQRPELYPKFAGLEIEVWS
jgi:predicted nucleic acid-binding protein